MTKALEGKDDFLFLTNDTNKVLEQIQGKKCLSAQEVNDWIFELEKRRNFCETRNCLYLYLIIPNKECVYFEKLPDNIKISSNRSILKLKEKDIHEIIRYPIEILTDHKKELVYHKTDTHWNALGCLYVFNELMNSLGYLTLNVNNLYEEVIVGDLGGETEIPKKSITKNISFDDHTKIIYDNCLTNTGRIIIRENSNNKLPSCIIFGDSFVANYLNIIANYFSKLYFFWGPCFDESIISKLNVNLVLNCNVERFIHSITKETKFNFYIYHKIILASNNEQILDRLVNKNYKYCDDIVELDHTLINNFLLLYKNFGNSKLLYKFKKLLFIYKFFTNSTEIYKNRKFIGESWRCDNGNLFVAWGVGFIFDNLKFKGINFYLTNILNNTFINLSVYNIKSIGREFRKNNNELVYVKKYFIEDLNVLNDAQEVFFDLDGLKLKVFEAYFILIEPEHFIGIGKSFRNIDKDLYFLRGFFKLNSQNIFLPCIDQASIAYKFIT